MRYRRRNLPLYSCYRTNRIYHYTNRKLVHLRWCQDSPSRDLMKNQTFEPYSRIFTHQTARPAISRASAPAASSNSLPTTAVPQTLSLASHGRRRMIPTLLYFSRGTSVWRNVGFQPPEKLNEAGWRYDRRGDGLISFHAPRCRRCSRPTPPGSIVRAAGLVNVGMAGALIPTPAR